MVVSLSVVLFQPAAIDCDKLFQLLLHGRVL